MNTLDSVDLTLLRTFRTVVERRSMTHAATDLGYVPSAVSQHITRLERLVGVQLLTRYPGEPVAPTAAGRQVLESASDVLAAAADFASACRALGDGAVELRVAVYATAACELLPAAIAALRRTSSAATDRMIQAEPDEGLPALASGAVDLLIAYRYLDDDLPTPAHVRETDLGEEPLPLIHPRAAADSGSLPWITGLPASPSRRLLERWAASIGHDLTPRYETEDPHTILSLCAEGLGQDIVPLSVLNSRHEFEVDRRELRMGGRPLTRRVLALTRRRYTHPVSGSLCASIQATLAGLNSGALPN